MSKKTVFTLLLVFLILLALELIGYLLINIVHDDYEQVRRILAGTEKFVGDQNMISQPYLLYVPSPNLQKHGYLQHNEHGYRGEKVPLQKGSNSYRILFLGGSTTYSLSVNDPDSTYPAQIGKILTEQFRESSINIEVINGGIPWGTSAEMLTHYLYKFRYYEPDLVVINTGGNDAYTHFLGGPYQPDYNHFRKSMTNIQAVAFPFNLLFHSRLFSFVIIRLFYDQMVRGGQFVHGGEEISTRWFDSTDTIFSPLRNMKYNAFYRNMNSLIRELKADSAKILLIPFLGNWSHETYTDSIINMTHFYNDMLKRISEEQDVYFAPFPDEVITDRSYWTDDCHLNAKGVEEKARHISRFIVPVINEAQP